MRHFDGVDDRVSRLKPMRRSPGRALTAALLPLILVSACGGSAEGPAPTTKSSSSSAATSDSVTIGAVLPLTGGSAALGKDQQRGIALAVEEINAAGGIGGKELKVKVEDSETTPVSAVQAARKLVTVDKVPLIVGELLSTNTIAVGKYTQQAGVPLISPATSSNDVGKIGDAVFSIQAPDSVAGKFTAGKLYTAGYRRIATVAPNNSYGSNIATAVKQEFTRLGGTVTTAILYTEGQPNYRAELDKLETSDAQMYVYASYEPDSVTILKNAFAMNLDAARFFGIYTSAIASGENLKAAAGQFGDDYPTVPGSEFAAAYKAKYPGDAPTQYSALAYDAVKFSADALDKAGDQTREAIRTSLQKIGRAGFTGATGAIRLGSDNEREAQEYVLLKVGSNGSLDTVTSISGPKE
ncbi:ABC transporter substrate-binding protein [Streptomyces sp. NPDC005708]|uniref:ABC transporter substrate-binding protein n=1 Tax=Streptomyces sp. NPDC005708 TaxID=3154564 RepID=UPI0034005601